jgi:hypothetical protein
MSVLFLERIPDSIIDVDAKAEPAPHIPTSLTGGTFPAFYQSI